MKYRMGWSASTKANLFLLLALNSLLQSQATITEKPCPQDCYCSEGFYNCRNISFEDIQYKSNKPLYHFSLSGSRQLKLRNNTFDGLTFKSGVIIRLKNNSIEEIETGIFQGLEEVYEINLGDNNLQHIDTNLFPADLRRLLLSGNPLVIPNNDPFLNIPLLDYLSLDNCKLTRIPSSMFQNLSMLTTLILRHNEISEIEPNVFDPLLILEYLDLAYNKIQTFHTDTFQYNWRLESMILDVNMLSIRGDKPFIDIPSLKGLSMSLCNLTYIGGKTFNRVKALEALYSMNNSLSYISENTFKNLRFIKYIDVRHNDISSMHPNAFNNNLKLEYLILTGNPLNLTANIPFLTASNLTYLHMDSCNISDIPLESFQNVPKLKGLTLRNNRFEKINETSLINLRDLDSIDFSGTPFSCKCVINEFKKWALTRYIRVRSSCTVEGFSRFVSCDNNI